LNFLLSFLWSVSTAAIETSAGIAVFNRCLDGLHNVLIPRAPAQVAGDSRPDLGFSGVWMPFQQAFGGHEHTGGAEPALYRPFVKERFLEGMETLFRLQAFHRLNHFAMDPDREKQAGIDRCLIHQNDAGAAVPLLTPPFGSRHSQVISEQVQKRDMGGNGPGFFPAVQGK
jgi:hypothetical protein